MRCGFLFLFLSFFSPSVSDISYLIYHLVLSRFARNVDGCTGYVYKNHYYTTLQSQSISLSIYLSIYTCLAYIFIFVFIFVFIFALISQPCSSLDSTHSFLP
ncbi:hypothetical protein P168DRAFT_36878 [Aspergillus campestris IBT 28561]|uniref:Uncharacterized protein n=1 Tax=Aspergillus campestris (strain IBT 28561) TaxID=1392248 RepID=A0A2I1CW84_ASPC2|nr:uncharacterized protein P168DRAFT_36878 [Aspergillus campestris IBT 28561]PKY01885.1 hypothetical protein P168DRAFT_36878 [Aspergillus campestris IBT 28561]